MSHLLPVPWAGSRAEAKTSASGAESSPTPYTSARVIQLTQADPEIWWLVGLGSTGNKLLGCSYRMQALGDGQQDQGAGNVRALLGVGP